MWMAGSSAATTLDRSIAIKPHKDHPHCEQNEAIHSAACGDVDWFVACAPRNDGKSGIVDGLATRKAQQRLHVFTRRRKNFFTIFVDPMFTIRIERAFTSVSGDSRKHLRSLECRTPATPINSAATKIRYQPI
jgi:hypothetical protein